MEAIQKERIIKEYYDAFVANDGTEFTDEEQCKKYEESALGVLMTRYKPLVVCQTTEYGFFDFGCEDNAIDIVAPKTQKDVDTLLQMYILLNDTLYKGYKEGKEWNTEQVTRAQYLFEQAMRDKEILLITRGYEGDCFYPMYTPSSMNEHFKEAAKRYNK